MTIELERQVLKFLVQPKKFEPAQNILEPEEGLGIRRRYNTKVQLTKSDDYCRPKIFCPAQNI